MPEEDVERIRQIREAVGYDTIRLRIDANQGWSYDDAVFALDRAMGAFNIQFCEQPMRYLER